MGFFYVWEFRVAPEQAVEFEQVYGDRGPWVQLFRRAPGYRGTLLLRDRSQPLRFITVDRWDSESAYRDFRAAFAREYAELDARCGGLTCGERSLGDFDEP